MPSAPIADLAIKHKTGARGLRTVLEETLMDVMYEIPGRTDIKKCVVNADCVVNKTRPLLLTRGGQAVDLSTSGEGVREPA
jgi:ATP-dependent Clp protease ATP-binding subunit ClpX (EC 3.4.21.92)